MTIGIMETQVFSDSIKVTQHITEYSTWFVIDFFADETQNGRAVIFCRGLANGSMNETAKGMEEAFKHIIIKDHTKSEAFRAAQIISFGR